MEEDGCFGELVTEEVEAGADVGRPGSGGLEEQEGAREVDVVVLEEVALDVDQDPFHGHG